ncbi:MAG TPA: TPM domain-containing protein [Gammaproteobacteria bacterium]
MRIWRHAAATRWTLTRRFDPATLNAIEQAIAESERTHRAEIRFAVEAALDVKSLWRCPSARRRAYEVFADLEIWDTAENNGVLIYVLIAEKAVEIVADHGFDGRVTADEWRRAVDAMDRCFERGQWRDGALAGIAEVSALAAREFPAAGETPDELPNRPLLL